LFRRSISVCLFLFFALPLSLRAEEVERDRCSCKLAMKGSESTLKGGTCVRTETSTCLMEWGGGSTTKVVQGKGLTQADAEAEYIKDSNVKFEIARLGSGAVTLAIPQTSDKTTQLQNALANLSVIPPSQYSEVPGIPESFVLAAGSALYRFSKTSLGPLTNFLLQTQRARFISILQKEGGLSFEQYDINGRTGCLQVNDKVSRVNVYIKTPFALSEGC
jgi:hypothetical protein